MARGTAAGEVALVDAADAFDPASASASGVDLSRVLWVRCEGRLASASRAVDLLARCPGFVLVAIDLGEGPLTARDGLSPAFGLRLGRAVEGSSAALIVRAPHRLAGTAAALVVSLRRLGSRWTGRPRPTRLAGLVSEARVLRSRSAPPREAWSIEWRL